MDARPPPPPAEATATLPVESPTPAPVTQSPTPTNPIPRRLQIAGGVMLPPGLVALGVVGAIASNHRRDLAEADALNAALQPTMVT